MFFLSFCDVVMLRCDVARNKAKLKFTAEGRVEDPLLDEYMQLYFSDPNNFIILVRRWIIEISRDPFH